MSFSAINIGTTTSSPVSQVTVLVDEVTVSPLTAGSAFVTINSTLGGSTTSIGLFSYIWIVTSLLGTSSNSISLSLS